MKLDGQSYDGFRGGQDEGVVVDGFVVVGRGGCVVGEGVVVSVVVGMSVVV